MPTTVDAIRSYEWRQGAVLPREANKALGSECGVEISEDACCIVISQSCDILHHDLESEPTVEVLVTSPCAEGLDGNYTFAKNARRLHFEVVIADQAVAYEVRSRNRVICNREVLGQWAPDTERTLCSDTIETLIRWVVSRYQRIAFPDAFNDRLRAQDGRLRRLFAKLEKLESIYVSLDTWDELSQDRAYKITLIGEVRSANYCDPKLRTALELGLGKVAACINRCEGMRVEEHLIRSDHEMTLQETKLLARWPLDFITLRCVDQYVSPPEEC